MSAAQIRFIGLRCVGGRRESDTGGCIGGAARGAHVPCTVAIAEMIILPLFRYLAGPLIGGG